MLKYYFVKILFCNFLDSIYLLIQCNSSCFYSVPSLFQTLDVLYTPMNVVQTPNSRMLSLIKKTARYIEKEYQQLEGLFISAFGVIQHFLPLTDTAYTFLTRESPQSRIKNSIIAFRAKYSRTRSLMGTVRIFRLNHYKFSTSLPASSL